MEMLQSFYSNEKAKQTLVNFITDGRLPHAVLLVGEQGCGKTHFARIMAAAVLCRGENKPCGECRNCRLVWEDSHPDITICSPDDPSKPYSAAALRELILSCYVLPGDGDKKIFILRNIEEMSEQSQNTLLKIIEEPPASVMFILTCTSRTRILPTILSRVVSLPLELCPADVCARALQEHNPDADPETCQHVARLTGGNIGRGLQIMQDERLSGIYQSAQDALEVLCTGTEFDFLCLLNTFNRKKDDFLLFLSELRQLFVQLIRQKNNPQAEKILSEGLYNRISTLQAMKILDIIDTVSAEVTQNVSVSLAAGHLCGTAKQALHG